MSEFKFEMTNEMRAILDECHHAHPKYICDKIAPLIARQALEHAARIAEDNRRRTLKYYEPQTPCLGNNYNDACNRIARDIRTAFPKEGE